MEWIRINKKRLVIFAATGLVLVVIWFLFNYTLMTFSYTSSDDEVFVSIRDSSQDNDVVNEFTLKNESKTLLLKRSSNRIEASASNKLTQYKKSLGFFHDSLDIELLPQQKSVFLGKSHLPCANEKASEILFSSCAPRGYGNTIISNQRGLLLTTDFSGLEAEFFAIGVLKNYGDGYLAAWLSDGQLKVTARETAENKTLAVSGFEGEINSNRFTTVPGSDIFAVYDGTKEELLVFADLKDSNPTRVNLSNELDGFDSRAEVEVFASENQVSLVVRDAGALEDFSHIDPEEGNEQTSFDGTNPRIITVDLSQNKVSQVHELSEDFIAQDVAAISPSGDLIILPATRDVSPLFFDAKGKSTEVGFLQKDVAGLCWENTDSFYYLANSSQQIYRYSIPKQASFLIYNGLIEDKFINSILCGQERLYFTIKNQTTNEFDHFSFSSEDFSGVRLEGILPTIIPFGSGREVINVELGLQSTVLIKPLFNNGSEATNKKARLKQLVVDEFRSKGVATEDLKFKFSF